MNAENKSLILVVDDQPKNLQLMASVLNERYKLILVDSGEKAILSAREKRPDLILLDVMMPNMSGFETCSELKKDPKTHHIPIIFLTAKVEETDIVEGYRRGAADYVAKPFRFEELKSRIEAHIGLKRQREEMVRLNQDLLKANNQKSKLFSVVSHDLKSGIIGLKELIKILKQDLKTSSKEDIDRVIMHCESNVENVHELLLDLLTWAKSQMEDASFSMEVLELKNRVEKVIQQLASQALMKHILLVSKVADERLVFADKDMLDTVLRNLIANAIKFSHEGGRVVIEAKTNGKEMQISIADFGIGIEEENLSKLFDKSSHFTKYGTAGEKGTGLGLDLCMDFVEQLNGKIWAESEYKKGSKFYFTLPLPKLQPH